MDEGCRVVEHASRGRGKVVRGNDIGGLLRYLFGPGRANEHTNPHIVAAWDDGVVAAHTSGSDTPGQIVQSIVLSGLK